MAILNNQTVEVKRKFHATPEKLYSAIGAGILFRTCGGGDTVKTDFREGGAYYFACGDAGSCEGKFLQLVPHSLITFSWPDNSTVSIRLTPESDGSTLMHLLHENIASEANAKDFDWGWRDGINDFSPHVGRTIVIERTFSAPLAKVYSIFSAKDFFAQTGCDVATGSHDFRTGGKFSFKNTKGPLTGEFTDITSKRIAFTWHGISPVGPTGETLVAIDFAEKDGKTLVKLTHSGFPSDEQAKIHNGGWTNILESLGKK